MGTCIDRDALQRGCTRDLVKKAKVACGGTVVYIGLSPSSHEAGRGRSAWFWSTESAAKMGKFKTNVYNVLLAMFAGTG